MFGAQWTRSTSDNRVRSQKSDRIGASFMAAERVERRLSAIFVADVAGYSRLMGADEEGTHARLNEHLSALLYPEIEQHGGGVITKAGGGIFVGFSSAGLWRGGATSIQRGVRSPKTQLP